MKITKILLSILLLFSLVACDKEEEYTLMNKVNLQCGFDTMCQLNAYVTSEEEFDKYYEEMSDLFIYYNSLFDIYNDYEGVNNIKTINDNAGIAPVEVDPVIIELIELAQEINELSDGAFDITNGAVLKVWHNYRDEGQILNSNGEYGDVPTLEELEAVADYHGFDYIEIDKEASTVYINDPNVSLDVGGVAKGFATEKVAQKLIEMGMQYGSVNAGGNQRIIGTKPDQTGFNVGITDPRGSGNIAVIPDQVDVSVVTSGDYQNYYIAEGDVRYSHIIDPDTLYPADHYTSVTIAVKDSGLADCLSTAFYVLDYEEGLKLIDTINEAYDLDVIVVWISNEPLDDTSIESPITAGEYITASANIAKALITE